MGLEHFEAEIETSVHSETATMLFETVPKAWIWSHQIVGMSKSHCPYYLLDHI